VSSIEVSTCDHEIEGFGNEKGADREEEEEERV